MKASNPDYGTWESGNGNYSNEGKICLFAHDFFEYVEQDYYKTGWGMLRNQIIKMNDEYPLYRDSNKYNL